MISGSPHLNQQAEERNHKVLMGTLDYQINFNDGNSSIISYLATQLTDRSHYTGIFPDEEDEINTHLNNTTSAAGTCESAFIYIGRKPHRRYATIAKAKPLG